MADSGELTGRGDALMTSLRQDVRDLDPQGPRESQMYQSVTGQAAAADAARIQRGDLARARRCPAWCGWGCWAAPG